jgi:DNA-binding beta-propeller fold protein YncE
VSSNIDRSPTSHHLLVRSFNQPKLCPNASWNPDGVTLANNDTIGRDPYGLFVNTQNTLFVANLQIGRIFICGNGSVIATNTIFTNLFEPQSLFVTADEEIFVDNGPPFNRVERWTSNGTQLPSLMDVSVHCLGLFVDPNNDLYCSQYHGHQVLRRPFQSPANPTMIVAGMGCPGSNAHRLNYPWGIFVTENFDLYVADSGNDRVQLFRSGEHQGMTVVGNGSNQTGIILRKPTGVVLDQDGYLFIVDNFNHRVIGSDRRGFRCLVGCSRVSGSAADQLNWPQTMNFDRDGNLLVLDTGNYRVQKFFLATNSCDGQLKPRDWLKQSVLLFLSIDSTTSMSSMSMTTSGTDQFTSTSIIQTTIGQKTIVNQCKPIQSREHDDIFLSFSLFISITDSDSELI